MRSDKLVSKNDESVKQFLSRPHIEVSSNGQIYSFYSSKFDKVMQDTKVLLSLSKQVAAIFDKNLLDLYLIPSPNFLLSLR